jgi:hypothetical protein
MKNVVRLMLLAAFATAVGCGGSGGGDFTLSEAGLSMDIPPGWSVGAPRMSGGFRKTPSGLYFFANAGRDLPHGTVAVMPLIDGSLEAHVADVVKEERSMSNMFQALTEVAGGVAGASESEVKEAGDSLETEIAEPEKLDLDGREAFAVTSKRPDLTTYRVFVQRGDKVVEVVYLSASEDFAGYEAAFKASAMTIRVR